MKRMLFFTSLMLVFFTMQAQVFKKAAIDLEFNAVLGLNTLYQSVEGARIGHGTQYGVDILVSDPRVMSDFKLTHGPSLKSISLSNNLDNQRGLQTMYQVGVMGPRGTIILTGGVTSVYQHPFTIGLRYNRYTPLNRAVSVITQLSITRQNYNGAGSVDVQLSIGLSLSK